MALAPVLFTFKVGLAAVFVVVNLTVISAPVIKAKLEQDTTFAAVAAAVEQVP